MSAAENPVLAKMKVGGRLPAPKGVAMEVISLTQRENASNMQIARLIGSDPALSVRIIKAANVLLGHASRPVATVNDAVTVLGARALRQLVLGIALIVDYRRGDCHQFDYRRYWTHSLLTGIAARHLSEHVRLAASEEVFVLGLLGNIGRLALATVHPEAFGAVLDGAEDMALDELLHEESARFGCDETDLSEAILADMHFPEIFQRLVRNFRVPQRSTVAEGSREWRLMHLLFAAELMADLYLAPQTDNGKLAARLKLQAAGIGVDEEALGAIGDMCARDWKEWSSLLSIGGWIMPDFSELLKQETPEVDADMQVQSFVGKTSYPMRVLVVEDDSPTRTLLEQLLRTAGHEVLAVKNGLEALRAMSQQIPQLVLTDWMMPEMDGLTLCRRMRGSMELQGVYVLMLTALTSNEQLVEAFDAGADDYLSKPLVKSVFMARLKAAQRVVRMQEELAYDREQLERFSTELAASNERLQRLALTDALTELPNRRFAMDRLEQEWALVKRLNRMLSCMMLDIDHFKSINDRFGHPAGDEALRAVSQVLRQSARTQDVVCRYGGEEFLLICPDTELEEAVLCAERLRLNIAAMPLSLQDSPVGLTVSVGVVAVRPGSDTMENLLLRADNCLYAAKEAGRNRVMSE